MSLPLLADVPDGVDESSWLAACSAVRGHCGWHVAPPVTETLTLDGPGGDVLHLPSQRVTAVASVISDGTAVANPEWSADGMVRTSGRWSRKFRGVAVDLTHGYDECPEEVLTVLRGMVAADGRGGVQSVTSGAHQVRYDPALSDSHRAILDRYRIEPLP